MGHLLKHSAWYILQWVACWPCVVGHGGKSPGTAGSDQKIRSRLACPASFLHPGKPTTQEEVQAPFPAHTPLPRAQPEARSLSRSEAPGRQVLCIRAEAWPQNVGRLLSGWPCQESNALPALCQDSSPESDCSGFCQRVSGHTKVAVCGMVNAPRLGSCGLPACLKVPSWPLWVSQL